MAFSLCTEGAFGAVHMKYRLYEKNILEMKIKTTKYVYSDTND